MRIFETQRWRSRHGGKLQPEFRGHCAWGLLKSVSVSKSQVLWPTSVRTLDPYGCLLKGTARVAIDPGTVCTSVSYLAKHAAPSSLKLRSLYSVDKTDRAKQEARSPDTADGSYSGESGLELQAVSRVSGAFEHPTKHPRQAYLIFGLMHKFFIGRFLSRGFWGTWCRSNTKTPKTVREGSAS